MASGRKRWFKVADSVLREDWTREQRSTFLGLLAWFNQRRQRDGCAGRAACEAPIPPGDLLTITLSDSLAEARAHLAALQLELHITVEHRDRFTFVRWPKLAIFQEWERPADARPTPGRRPADAPSVSDSVTDSEEKKKNPPTPRRRGAAAAPPSEWALGLAGELSVAVRRRWPGAQVPGALTAWARELARVKADPAEVAALLRWYSLPEHDGDRFMPEARAARSFREKWNALVAARERRTRERQAPAASNAALFAEVDEILRRDREVYGT